MGRRAGIRVIDGETVVSGSNICRHGIEQRSGNVIAGVVSIEGTVKSAKLIPGVLPACNTGRDAILVIGLSQKDGFRAACALACLRRVNVQPDPGDHLVRQVHAGEADDADVVVAGIIEFLTGCAAFSISGGCVFPRTERRGIMELLPMPMSRKTAAVGCVTMKSVANR